MGIIATHRKLHLSNDPGPLKEHKRQQAAHMHMLSFFVPLEEPSNARYPALWCPLLPYKGDCFWTLPYGRPSLREHDLHPPLRWGTFATWL